MPSSMIFTGLVVLWLIVLVPAVARHRQEVARPSVVALSSRVLDRPQRRRSVEVNDMQVDAELDGAEVEAADPVIPSARPSYADDVDGYAEDDREWERPPPRYRPGRGGYDAEAAALTARARYTFRQRVVLALMIAAVVSAAVAAVVQPLVWWLHGAFDAVLVGYLVYLRRQVRMEEQIRARRAARTTGARRRPVEDEWEPEPVDVDDTGLEVDVEEEPEPDELATDTPERVTGTGEPVGPLRPVEGVVEEPALPRLQPAPPPPLPVGTTLVEADDEDVALGDLDLPHRRAVGE